MNLPHGESRFDHPGLLFMKLGKLFTNSQNTKASNIYLRVTLLKDYYHVLQEKEDIEYPETCHESGITLRNDDDASFEDNNYSNTRLKSRIVYKESPSFNFPKLSSLELYERIDDNILGKTKSIYVYEINDVISIVMSQRDSVKI